MHNYREKRGHIVEGRRCGDVIWGRKESLVLQRGGSSDQREREREREREGKRGKERERERGRETTQHAGHCTRKTLPQDH